METVILGLVAGLKLAIFFIVLVYAYLAGIPFQKNKNIYWLILMAVAFILIAFAEFIHIVGHVGSEYMLWEWIMDHGNQHLFADSFYLIAVIGILFFLSHINKNPKEYR